MKRCLMSLALGALTATALSAQWATTYDMFYLQAPHNWVFRNQYQSADRLFNAFDYGHAILYERLLREPDAPVARLEEDEYDKLTKRVLVRPPRVPLVEEAIEVHYARLAPEAKAMFDWAHMLHRQIYDVLADERLDDAAKDREVARVVAYYRTRPELAFSGKPKSMKLMQEQPYSLAFRKAYPKFNGLIWAYHWLQVGLYEPLLVGTTASARQSGVRVTVARFWQMLNDAPTSLPYQMPMTAAVSPRFTERFTEAAIIFDNLHSMHDAVSDILANPSVPRNRKRAEILLAARRFRDDTSYVMPVTAWKIMAGHMGIENMGGPAVGVLGALPTPSVTRGAVMQHDDATGAMTGFAFGSATSTSGGHAEHHAAPPDSQAQAFAAMQQRGKVAMGVDQYTSVHRFEDLPDGGRITLERDRDDSVGTAAIQQHLRGIEQAFSRGDFSTPAFVHLREVPGAAVMAAKRDVIMYHFRPLPRGGELHIMTSDAAAVRAVHEFLAFQRSDHRTH